MNCLDVIEYILDLDNDQELPPAVADHLRHCDRCSEEVRRIAFALTGMQRTAPAEDRALTERVMGAVRDSAATEVQPTRLRSWVIVGALIVVGVTGLRFSEVMTWLRQSMGPAIDVAMSVILGLFLTGYICMLVGSNMQRVLRIFRHR